MTKPLGINYLQVVRRFGYRLMRGGEGDKETLKRWGDNKTFFGSILKED